MRGIEEICIEKNIGIIPTIGHSFEDMFTEKNTFFSEFQGENPMYTVKKMLEANGIALRDATKLESSKGIDMFLYFGNIDLQMLSKFKDSINIYFAFEPPTVDTGNEKGNLLRLKKYFDYIVTWDDDLVDGEVFLKFNYCVDFFDFVNDTSFEDKKLLTNISGNKKSKHIDELYSKRLDVINFFEKYSQDDFKFWGTGWNNNNYKNYRGTAVSKAEIYKNYKFAICFENQKRLNGYVTEKILDCFICKIVPVYWGADNIASYVPKGCFIDYRDFNDTEHLVEYLKNISKDQYYEYIRNIESFLNSDGVDKFTPREYSNIIMGLLDKNKKVSLTSVKINFLKFLKIKIRLKNHVQAV